MLHKVKHTRCYPLASATVQLDVYTHCTPHRCNELANLVALSGRYRIAFFVAVRLLVQATLQHLLDLHFVDVEILEKGR